MRFSGSALVAGVALLSLTACSTPSQEEEPASNATDSMASVDGPQDLKIAFFQAGSNNAYLQANIEAAKAAAEEMGASLDVFDAQWTAQSQADQIQTALTSGKYNAFTVLPVDGNLVCDPLTEDAKQAGVMVSVMNVPICGRETNVGDELAEPGTVTFVGGQTRDVYEQWVDQVIEDNPNGGKVALLAGPDLSANTINFREAAEKLKSNGFEIVATQTTDYSTPQAAAAAQTILRANPELDILMSNYTGMSRGVVQAIEDAKRDDVKVYDFGGDSWALDQVRDGTLASTVVMLPKQEAAEAVRALGDAASGKDVPKFIDLTESDALPGTPFVTPDNVEKFTAEY